MKFTSLPQAFLHSVERYPEEPALKHVVDGEYVSITYRELKRRARQFALGLLEFGVGPGDRVGMISENRPEWAIADLGMLSIGAVNTPVFPTLPPTQLEYLFKDSGARVVIVSSREQLDKMLAIRDALPALEKIVVFDEDAAVPGVGVVAFRDVAPSPDSEGDLDEERQRRMGELSADTLASIIYTSGTTGDPKGTMLTHGNFLSNSVAVSEVFALGPGDCLLSVLPLNHVFERLVGHYVPLFLGVAIAYAESLVKLTGNMLEVQPTVIVAVPRLYETMISKIRKQAAQGSSFKRSLINWALDVAARWSRKVVGRERPGIRLSLSHALAHRLVYRKIHSVFGGRIRVLVSAGAPLPSSVGYLFHGMGFVLLEGYGLTETSPTVTVNRSYDTLKVGTVGPPLTGIEVIIAEDGEILVRGPNVMKGYWKKPKETAAAIDSDGFFHTGDIGHLDEDGYLVITDRKKNILVLASGKKIAPAPIEHGFKASDLIADVMLIGDGQDHVTALVVPDYEELRRRIGLEDSSISNEDLVSRVESVNAVSAEIERLSADLAAFEKVRRIALLPRELTVEAGELTPTLKLRRKVVLENYADQIGGMA